jgi:hypothetical protein
VTLPGSLLRLLAVLPRRRLACLVLVLTRLGFRLLLLGRQVPLALAIICLAFLALIDSRGLAPLQIAQLGAGDLLRTTYVRSVEGCPDSTGTLDQGIPISPLRFVRFCHRNAPLLDFSDTRANGRRPWSHDTHHPNRFSESACNAA